MIRSFKGIFKLSNDSTRSSVYICVLVEF